jgi:hypothetical protein
MWEGKLVKMSHLKIRRSWLFLHLPLMCRGSGISGSAYTVWQIRKHWLWCHSGPTSTRTGRVPRQFLPCLLLWRPSQWMEEARGSCPCFVWQLSQWSVTWEKWRQGQQQNMVDLSSSGLENSKHTASPGYHSPWFELSTGYGATWAWNSPSRKGLSSSHCGCISCHEFRVSPWTHDVMVW